MTLAVRLEEARWATGEPGDVAGRVANEYSVTHARLDWAKVILLREMTQVSSRLSGAKPAGASPSLPLPRVARQPLRSLLTANRDAPTVAASSDLQKSDVV